MIRESLGRFAPLSPLYTPRGYQLAMWQALVMEQRRRNVWVMHRRAGKDLTVWNAFIWLAQHWRVGTYYYSLPTQTQARRTIWRNLTKQGIRFRSCIPRNVVAVTNGRPATNSTEMLVEFKNGSILQLVGGDNYDSIVGANPVAICFSEWSLTNPAALDFFRPMVTENDGLLVFLYTPRGHNHGKRTYDRYERLARENPARYFCEMQTVRETGAITEAQIQEDRDEGMSESMVQQEYYCDFDVANEGSYYGSLMTQARKDLRIGDVPGGPALTTHLVFDIGVSDHTVIGFVQVLGTAIYGVDYYANHGYGVEHYVEEIERRGRERGYRYRRDQDGKICGIGPHDAGQRSRNDGKKYSDYALEKGLRLTILKREDLESGIEVTRGVLPRMYWDRVRCERWIEAMESYTKEWNDALKVWGDKPRHDWASHPADMTRYLAQAEKAGLLVEHVRREATKPAVPWYAQPSGMRR